MRMNRPTTASKRSLPVSSATPEGVKVTLQRNFRGPNTGSVDGLGVSFEPNDPPPPRLPAWRPESPRRRRRSPSPEHVAQGQCPLHGRVARYTCQTRCLPNQPIVLGVRTTERIL